MTIKRLHLIRTTVLCTILFLLASMSFMPATMTPLLAQTPAQSVVQDHVPDAISVTTIDNALSITWPNPALVSASAVDLLQRLPIMRFQGYLLPMQLLTVEVEEGQALDLQLIGVRTQSWQGTVEPAAPLAPLAVEWQALADPTAVVETVALPQAPLFVLRQGRLHGKQIAVLAVSPLYAEAGVTKVATDFTARAARTRLVDSQLLRTGEVSAHTWPNSRDNRALAPVNPDALRNALKVLVSEAGMQQLTGAALAAAGFDLNRIDPARLQLRHNGAEVALQIDGVVGGKLTTAATLRFYTAQVGDRWNVQETYWLTEGDSAGLRMSRRSVAQGAAPLRTTAFEQGIWEDPLLYDSRYEGIDGDHWFHRNLLASQANAAAVDEPSRAAAALVAPVAPAGVAATLTPRLPRVADTGVYTVAVTTNLRGEHALRVQIGNDQQDVTWSSVAANELVRNWQHVVTSTAQSNLLDISLLSTPPATDKDATILLDKVAWQVPVQLNFGGNGAQFVGVAGQWRYQWLNLPSGYTFYDVTNGATPALLSGADANGFQDGPAPRTYLIAGPGTLHTPTVVAHTPLTVTGVSGADAIYIGPAQFLTELGALLQLRRDQGYSVVTVDVQAIYDGWNFGQVSPEAIRSFLRYAAANWQPAPRAVTLVGDGTVDPHNYEKKGNVNFIPPYLAKVDLWLIEAACEPCYAQLDGDHPVTGDDPEGHFFAADLWIGRLPVKSSGELAGLVNKIVSYERATSLEGWQNINVFVADNYIKSLDGSGQPVKDLAGDFAKISDGIVALAPSGVRTPRIYYDPYPQLSDPSGTQRWRITDAAQARNDVIAQLSAGAGLVTYNGHSHHWQWAITDERPNADPNWLLGLYDTDLLSNKNRYFVGLSMTCLTSQFQKPAFSGTVLDERLILNASGGAVALWGPAGLSVAFGHDLLQRGFYDALWSAPPLTAKMGALIEAGSIALLTEGSCCQDTLKTFLLLGDPLTTVRVYPSAIPELYLPLIRR